ncbi:DUF1156 domain-containing protein [Bremerella sp. T1]|uniref:DUF1156 domain-containing protein n=1 Tax=Bremerella sp. TYQ1 TaxID=3119568 RepID=UPI001CCF32CC|nr:DUF1156 domain-containing protein [Bremerella volcania]UBM33746.1 DUF1156 domain-containing protein [Bremerella volcania]
MTEHPVISPKKLIEVALPLDVINKASVREGYIYRGNPSALHKWWAQRPLAAARAVIFSQLVNDPEDVWRIRNPNATPNSQVKGHWTKQRERLFQIIEQLVVWENTNDAEVLALAHKEIRRSWKDVCELNQDHPESPTLFDPESLPSVYDPFAGGGTIPLEAQRLGLIPHATDLNPVAVLLNKAMVDFPARFSGKPAANSSTRDEKSLLDREWSGIAGIEEDIRKYGRRILEEVRKRIGEYFPTISPSVQMRDDEEDVSHRGRELPVIAWLWARSVKSPNPAFSHVDVPLTTTFVLSSRKGKEAFVEPIISSVGYSFVVRHGTPPSSAKKGTKAGRGAKFRCVMSQTPIEPEYIKAEAMAGRMGKVLMAIVAIGEEGRTYLSPTAFHEDTANSAKLRHRDQSIEVPIAEDPRPMTCLLYGMKRFDQLFLERQKVALTTISDVIKEFIPVISSEALAAGYPEDQTPLCRGGSGALAYSEALATYLTFALDKTATYNCALVPWNAKESRPNNLFTRQAIPILWDVVELNPLEDIGGTFIASVNIVAGSLAGVAPAGRVGIIEQHSATDPPILGCKPFVSTDPPYYDNIGYADLSDFFYVWLRRTLRDCFPELLATINTPKSDELVATAFRHGGKNKAEKFFLKGMAKAMENIAKQAHPAAPITIYYAFKQSDTSNEEGTSSAGWMTFLQAVLDSGLAVTGTWPIRTERSGRMRDAGSNALASSIVLVCRPRTTTSTSISRRDFIRELNTTLPAAMDAMTREAEELPSPVAPVDLSQAIIGPGMAVFSKYSAVLEADGAAMSVKNALQLINRFLAEDDFDSDTQFCLHWFEQHGWENNVFGSADVLARAKDTSVNGLAEAGVVQSGGGKVRLLKWNEYPADWDPSKDFRTPVWEALHHLIRALKQGGESAAGKVLEGVASKAEAARQLAYRLYTLCERKGWAEDARAYNELITSWPAIESAAPKIEQRELF